MGLVKSRVRPTIRRENIAVHGRSKGVAGHRRPGRRIVYRLIGDVVYGTGPTIGNRDISICDLVDQEWDVRDPTCASQRRNYAPGDEVAIELLLKCVFSVSIVVPENEGVIGVTVDRTPEGLLQIGVAFGAFRIDLALPEQLIKRGRPIGIERMIVIHLER